MDRTQARIVDVPIDAIHDDHKNKGEFVEMEASYLTNMFKDLVLEEGYELGAVLGFPMNGITSSPKNIKY